MGINTGIKSYITYGVLYLVFLLSAVAGFCSQPVKAEDSPPFWIFFSDKGINQERLESELSQLNSTFNSKSLRRRARAGLAASVDVKDLPVNPEYINEITKLDGVELRHVSRWLNAISVDVMNTKLDVISEKSFVSHIQTVRRFYRNPDLNMKSTYDQQGVVENLELPERDWNLEYGRSLRQNLFLNVPRIHDAGITGEGVVIGVLDAGFDNLDHNCFEGIDILDSWDFVNDDGEVGDEDDRGDGNHGTKTLSIIGGFEEDTFVGIAFGATFILGKTEDTEWERPIEEDHWVAGIEWMDELGVEIVSSSLSYTDWYDYEDMDGEIGVTTVAAQRAAELGIIVCSSMGNNGRADYPRDKMGAPSDAWDVYSIGAVNTDSSFASWSSQGPTIDGRIKPDFTTIGSNVISAGSRDNEIYANGSGTSFSAPAIAGLCALLLQANPYLNPISMREVLRSVSDNNEDPDTLLGWGIPDGFAALMAIGFEESQLAIPLRGGWSTISSNLLLNALDIGMVVGDLVEAQNLILLKDGSGNFYSPPNNFNNIPFWNFLEGYQILVGEEDVLLIDGTRTLYTRPIELIEGWQIVSYLPTFQIDAVTAFGSLTDNDNLVIVKDDRGRFYFPQFNFSNMSPCREGRGYHIKLEEDDVLVYPRRRLVDAEYSIPETPVAYRLPEPAEKGMSILILTGEGVENQDEIAFKDDSGNILGSGIVIDGKCGIALWAGNENSELPNPELYSYADQQFYTISLIKNYGPTGYIPDEIAVYRTSPRQINGHNTSEEEVISLHPNPFNQIVTIRIGIKPTADSRLVVYNNQGQELVNELWGDGNSSQKTLKSSDWASGTYYFSLKSNGKSVLGTARHLK